MKQTRFLILALAMGILSSCGTGMKVSKEELSVIDKDFKARFDNSSSLTKRRNDYTSESTILRLFQLFKANASAVLIQFDSQNRLQLSFTDSSWSRTESFQGRFGPKGYYEVVFRKKKKAIPPLIPFIYSSRDIYILRLALSRNQELIIDHRWAKDENIFLFGGGGSGHYSCYFKQIPNGP